MDYKGFQIIGMCNQPIAVNIDDEGKGTSILDEYEMDLSRPELYEVWKDGVWFDGLAVDNYYSLEEAKRAVDAWVEENE